MPYGTINADLMTTSDGVSSSGLYGMKSRIINGAMVIDQRNAGASYTNSNQSLYGLDRWRSYGLGSCVLTVQQSTTAPAGFSNSQFVTVTTSTTANDTGGLSQIIEGNNVFDLNWGTSSGVAVTASFWVRASVIGTYNIYLRYLGSTATYYYVATYTVNAANTWEQKTINIAAPPVGAGAFTAALNSSYLEFRPVINSSGNTTTVTANTWSTTNATKTTGAVDLASNSGATFYITGVQLEKGSTATSFDYRPYGTELQLCQRYFEKTYDVGTAPATATDTGRMNYSSSSEGNGNFITDINFKITKRTAPTLTAYVGGGTSGIWTYEKSSGSGTNAVTFDLIGQSHVRAYVSIGTNWVVCYVYGHWTASAEL